MTNYDYKSVSEIPDDLPSPSPESLGLVRVSGGYLYARGRCVGRKLGRDESRSEVVKALLAEADRPCPECSPDAIRSIAYRLAGRFGVRL